MNTQFNLQQPGAVVGGYEPAPPDKRIIAFLIDYGVIFAASIVSGIVAGIIGFIGGFIGGLTGNDVIILLVLVFSYAVYGILFLGIIAFIAHKFWRNGLSVGKHVMKLRVVSKNTMDTPTFGTMILRETIGKFISNLLCGLGYIWFFFDAEKQTWHDKIVTTYVVKQ